MNVLFITRKFPPSTGGMELHAYDLYTSLAKKAQVGLLKWGGSNKYLPLVLPYFLLRASARLMRGGVDVIYVQDGVLAPLGYVLSKVFRKPYVLTVHGKDITFKNALFQAFNVRCVARAAAVICVSQATATEAQARGIPAEKIHVVPNGLHNMQRLPREQASKCLRERLSVGGGTPLLLTVGRLVERKGVAWFVDNVMPQLVKRHPSLLYLVAGEGEQQAAIEAGVARHHLEKHVQLLGRVDDTYRQLLYSGADVFVQPNVPVPGDIEGFGLVLLEASLCELPVVATGMEGILEAITDGQNGILVPTPKDAPAFAAAISRFLDDPAASAAFGRRSRAFTRKHFDWEALADRYLSIFASVKR